MLDSFRQLISDPESIIPQKLHWYSFTFTDSPVSGQTRTASIYLGYSEPQINIARIESAKRQAGVDPSAVMLSCCYLGSMTSKEMKGE